MNYNPVTRPSSRAKRREVRNQMLQRGWHPVPADFPKDALLRVPVKRGPTFDDVDRSDCDWTEIWAICLWAKLQHHGRGDMKTFALELQRHKESPRLKLAICVSTKLSASYSAVEGIAIDATLKVLDQSSQSELQQDRSFGPKQ